MTGYVRCYGSGEVRGDKTPNVSIGFFSLTPDVLGKCKKDFLLHGTTILT